MKEMPNLNLPSQAAQSAVAESSRGLVLVVDDDPVVRKLTRDILSKVADAVHLVACGEDAVRVAPQLDPDLILLDVTMPELDGPSLAYHLRNKSPDLPVVLMTGHVESAVRSDDLDVPVVTKPFDFARLTAVVRDELATRT